MKTTALDLKNFDYDVARKELNEKQFRHLLAQQAMAYGYGGISVVSRLAHASTRTISKGIKELREGCDDLDGRIRRPGGGRKPLSQLQPGLKGKIRELVEYETYGGPEKDQPHVRASLRKLSKELGKEGFSIRKSALGVLMKDMGYTLQQNKKADQVGEPSPYRDEQFKHIQETIEEAQKAGNPVISVDTKKKRT